MVQETGLFISGGAETTRTVIARGLVELTRHPDQWEAMAADPSLIPGAVEELIRWVTPLNNFFRTATRDDDIAGTDVRAGDRVILLYPSANRDEPVFDDPYTFDIRRDPNPHVAFGFGTHFCLGASLARLELRMLLARLTAPDHQPARGDATRHRAEHLRRRRPLLPARVRPPLMQEVPCDCHEVLANANRHVTNPLMRPLAGAWRRWPWSATSADAAAPATCRRCSPSACPAGI